MKTVYRFGAGLCAALTLVVSTPLPVFAEDETTPSGLAYSDVREEIEAYAREYPDDYVSFAAAVVTPDEILYSGTFGYADRDAQLPADEDTVYEWGSITKTLVWVSVMQLWEQGKLDLNADIRTYLPENFFHNLEYPDDSITMLNIMNHTAGWTETTYAIQTEDAGNIPTLEQALQNTEPNQLCRPGTVSSYANWGAALAGYVVECISGESFSDYAHKHIFEPLGMEHTSVSADRSDNEWVKNQREKLKTYAQVAPNQWQEGGSGIAYITLYPAGSATGTIGDIAKYVQSFVKQPCPLFEKQETLHELLSPTLTLAETGMPSVCHGLFPEVHGGKMTYGHNGATTACTSNLRFEPESGIGVVTLMNGSGDPHSEIVNRVLGSDPDTLPEAYQTAGKNIGDISGIYFSVRSIWHGPLKLISLLSVMPVTKNGEDFTVAGTLDIHAVGNNICILKQNGAFLGFGETGFLENGNKKIDLGGMAIFTDAWALVCLITAVLYSVLLVIGAVLVLIKLAKRVMRKNAPYLGARWVSAGQIARVVSILLFLLLISQYSVQYGAQRWQIYLLCGGEILCLAVFTGASISALHGMFSKSPEKASAGKYAVNFLANGFSAFALIALELVRFWNL